MELNEFENFYFQFFGNLKNENFKKKLRNVHFHLYENMKNEFWKTVR